MSTDIKKYLEALSIVKQTRASFFEYVEKMLNQRLKSSSILLPRQMEISEISKIRESYKITDQQVIKNLDSYNYAKILITNFQFDGINAQALFFVSNSCPCSLVAERYFLQALYVTSQQLDIINQKMFLKGFTEYPEIIFPTPETFIILKN